jgi:phosphopantetheine adenylyltransferase
MTKCSLSEEKDYIEDDEKYQEIKGVKQHGRIKGLVPLRIVCLEFVNYNTLQRCSSIRVCFHFLEKKA